MKSSLRTRSQAYFQIRRVVHPTSNHRKRAFLVFSQHPDTRAMVRRCFCAHRVRFAISKRRDLESYVTFEVGTNVGMAVVGGPMQRRAGMEMGTEDPETALLTVRQPSDIEAACTAQTQAQTRLPTQRWCPPKRVTCRPWSRSNPTCGIAKRTAACKSSARAPRECRGVERTPRRRRQLRHRAALSCSVAE